MSKGLTTEEKKELKAKAKEAVMEELGVSEEEAARVEDMLKLAQMPIELKDNDIKMGKGEVDIRKLSPENRAQLEFRMSVLRNLYLKDISSSLIDLLRLNMIIAKKLGVDDIIKATDEIQQEMLEATKKQMN